jgi:hypothetical protein
MMIIFIEFNLSFFSWDYFTANPGFLLFSFKYQLNALTIYTTDTLLLHVSA